MMNAHTNETTEITVLGPSGRTIQVVPADWTLRTLPQPSDALAPAMALVAPPRGVHALAVVVPPSEFETLVAAVLGATVFGGEL